MSKENGNKLVPAGSYMNNCNGFESFDPLLSRLSLSSLSLNFTKDVLKEKRRLRRFRKAAGFLRNCLFGPKFLNYETHFGRFIPVNIAQVNTPTDFYVQPKDMLTKLSDLTEKMTNWYERHYNSNSTPLKRDQIKLGGFYAGKSRAFDVHQDKWIRVQVSEKPNPREPLHNGVYCALIDYGGIQFFEFYEIRPLRKIYADALPWVAYSAYFSSINPSLIGGTLKGNYKGQLDAESFREMCVDVWSEDIEMSGVVITEEPPNRRTGEPFVRWGIFMKATDPSINWMASAKCHCEITPEIGKINNDYEKD